MFVFCTIAPVLMTHALRRWMYLRHWMDLSEWGRIQRVRRRWVTGLSEILRYSLTSDRRETVPLAEEMSVVDEYVAVERARFEERLRVEKVIEPAALSAPVPPMIVQTLVENAVKHGIAMLPRGGVVRIDIGIREHNLHIVVTNTGRLLEAAAAERAAGADSGFGLQNTAERLSRASCETP